MNKQLGFTLIELMIALALGLVISAAAIMLFLTAQRSQALQQGLANVQDDSNFGLNYITKDIRLGNLNTIESGINDRIAYAGIVFTSSAFSDKDTSVSPAQPLSNLYRTITGATANVNLLSRSHGHTAGSAPAWTGVSNSDGFSSDQLVIQYMPQYILDDKGTARTDDDRWYGGFDCEGNELEFTLTQGRQIILQRYFLRPDTNTGTNEPNEPLALACDSGYYPKEGNPTAVRGFGAGYGDAGQIIMKRADHFRVLYGIQNGNVYRYVSASDYMGMVAPRPRILSVQLGVLVRSSQSVGNDATFRNDQIFQVLDQAIRIKSPAPGAAKYARDVVTQTVALRNTFGERGR